MKKTSTPSTQKSNPNSVESGRAALDALRKKIEELGETETIAVNTNVVGAVTIALAAAPRIEALIGDMQRLPFFDIEHPKLLRTYAMALWFTDAVATAPDVGRFNALVDEAMHARRSLFVGVDALVDRGLLSRERVAEIRAGSGHHDAAKDLVALGELCRANWKNIEHKTAITLEEVARAEELGTKLLRALVERRDNVVPPELMRQRARVFTLFARAYDQCRRAIAYLRWGHRDVDEIAPSIYARRRKRTTSEASEGPEPPAIVEPPAAEPAPGPTSPEMPELPLMD